MYERERDVECKGRQSKNGGGYGGYVQRLLQDIYKLVISDSRGVVVLPSSQVSAPLPVTGLHLSCDDWPTRPKRLYCHYYKWSL
jgi:hypothetical protein